MAVVRLILRLSFNSLRLRAAASVSADRRAAGSATQRNRLEGADCDERLLEEGNIIPLTEKHLLLIQCRPTHDDGSCAGVFLEEAHREFDAIT